MWWWYESCGEIWYYVYPCYLYVEGGKIEGASGIYAKSGEITITGGEIIGNRNSYVAPKANGDGADPTGDAIILDTNANYIGNIKLSISNNAKITSQSGYAVHETITDTSTESKTYTISITGGNFESGKTDKAVSFSQAFVDAAKDSTKGNISLSLNNGTFNAPVPNEYCSEGFKVEATEDEHGNPVYGVVEKDKAEVDGTKYDTLAEAFANANNKTITLLEDVVLVNRIEINDNENIILDLNGKSIKTNSSFSNESSGLLLVHNGGTLTINDSTGTGKITTEGTTVYASVALTKAGDANTKPAKLIVNGGTLQGYYYAIVGNGGRHNTEVTINGGTIEGLATNDSFGIYNPQRGSITITGGTVKGASAIGIKSGELNITGGELIANGAFVENPKTNGNGINGDGSTIVVDSNVGYDGQIKINITGGTLTSAYGYTIKEFGGDSSLTNLVEVKVSGNPTLTAADEKENLSIREVTNATMDVKVSGGTFSSQVQEKYCAEGFAPVYDEQTEKYTVEEATFVAQIGDDKYTSLQDAIDAATAGQTINIIGDFVIEASNKETENGYGVLVPRGKNGTDNGRNHV